MGERNQSLLRLIGSGECTFAVFEELAAHQFPLQRPTVLNNERLIGPIADRMNGACHYVFARTALACNEHRNQVQNDLLELRITADVWKIRSKPHSDMFPGVAFEMRVKKLECISD